MPISTPTIAGVADAVKAALNHASFRAVLDGVGLTAYTFSATRAYLAKSDLSQLGSTLAVLVQASSNTIEPLTRTSNQKDIVITVGVQKKIAGKPTAESANTEIDPLLLLVEKIADSLYSGGGTAGGAQWLRSENPLMYDPVALDAGYFFSTVRFTFKVL